MEKSNVLAVLALITIILGAALIVAKKTLDDLPRVDDTVILLIGILLLFIILMLLILFFREIWLRLVLGGQYE